MPNQKKNLSFEAAGPFPQPVARLRRLGNPLLAGFNGVAATILNPRRGQVLTDVNGSGVQRNSARIRILVVDGHFAMRKGLSACINLEKDMMVVAEAGGSREALVQFHLHKPDLVLTDLRLPDGDGIALIGQLCRAATLVRVVVFSAHGGDGHVHRALEAGARGYLLKSDPAAELNNAIRAVHGGYPYLTSSVAAGLALYISRPTLSERELEVLNQIACGKNNGEIAFVLNISEITVKRHVGQILQKLAVHDRTQAMAVAIQRGILQMDGLHNGPIALP